MIPTCHPEQEYGGRGMCRPCYQRWRYTTHPEIRAKLLEQMRTYHQLHKEEIHARHKEYYRVNKKEWREYERKWRLRHPDRERDHSLQSNHGITQYDYDQMLLQQNGKCAICEQISIKPLDVDHDHTTNVIRGLVCHRCNLGLRMVDNEKKLQAALEYLKSPPAGLILNESLQVKI